MTTQLTDYLDDCLQEYGYTLTPKGRNRIGSMVGEVITNAEDHSGLSQWWVAAYMRRRAGELYGDCHVTMFGFGSTLSESLRSLPTESLLRQDIERLVGIHGRRALFGNNWTEEGLWTLYALQEGVSRHNTSGSSLGDRGQGTADMIQYFQQLGQSSAAGKDPEMCLVSGRTHITFSKKYPIRMQQSRGGEMRRIIALNADNDLELAPDQACVRHLSRNFPGTIISMRFFLDRRHLDAIGGASGNRD